VKPTASRQPRAIQTQRLHGVSMEDLLEVLDEFEEEFPIYEREVRALKRIVKASFPRFEQK
jgi:hypothetical protein